MQNTDFFDIEDYLSFCFFVYLVDRISCCCWWELHFQLVVHILGARDPIRDFTDEAPFLGGVDRPAQGDLALVVMIFTFLAFTDMFFPAMISLRICAVVATSAL